MRIFVKNLKGNHFRIEVKPQHTVGDVKKNIESVQGANVFPASQQMLIYQGKVLADGTTLEENKVAENSFIVVMLSKAPATHEFPCIEASTTPPTTVPSAALPASVPTSMPAPIISSSVSESDVGGQATSSLDAGNYIENTIQNILDMGEGVWDRDTVVHALHVASNNPERAVEYLKSSKSLPGESSVAAAANPAMPTSEAPGTPDFPVEASTKPPITVTDASLPASVPTSVPAPIISSSVPQSNANDQAASNLVGNDLENTIQHILDMGGGSWDRDTVVLALCAASNNPEIAVEYLYSGIPEQSEVPSLAQSIGTLQDTNSPSIGAQQSTQPTSVLPSGPNAGPMNIFPQGLPIVGSDAAPSGALDFLRNSELFQALRTMVQANPQVLQPMLQELGKQNPNVMGLIQEHQAEFHRLLNEPVEGEAGNILEQFARPQAIQVTPGEHAAIERLEALGFDRSTVLEAYFACNKNEELTANYLLDHMGEF